jgi:protein gp37
MRKNWEIVKGCERLTAGCDSCPSYWHYYQNGLDYTVKTQMQNLDIPKNDLFTKVYSVAHGSDLFHESVSVDDLKKIFQVMNNTRHHCFEIVTKRIERASCVASELEFSENIWLGVALESGEYRWRVDYLKKIPAKYKFISACPILGAFPQMDLSGINQVGVVEETWGFKRSMRNEWVEDLKEQCKEQEVEFTVNDSYLWEAN